MSRGVFKVLLTSILCLLMQSSLFSCANATIPSWKDIGREISLGLYLAAKEDLLKLSPQTEWERDRKALALAFVEKRLNEKDWFLNVKEISPSSPYRQAANLLLEEQVIVPESIKGVKRRYSPFMRKFYRLWRIDKRRALRLLLWAPDIPEKRRAVQIAFNRLFYAGEDEMLVGTYKSFKSLQGKVPNLRKLALAYWREGDLKASLRAINKALRRAPRNKELLFWKARILHRMGRLEQSVALLRRVRRGLSNGFYTWYSRVLLGTVEYRGSRCPEEGSYPNPVLYALAESGLIPLGQKVLKENTLNMKHPDLLSNSDIYPYQSLRLSYLQSENGEFCVRYPQPWREMVRAFCELYGLSPEMLYALVKAESAFNRTARSYSNALGLTQVLPSTGRWIQKQRGEGYRLYPNQPFLPFFSLQLGGWYLSYLEGKFNGRWPLVVASYNGGPGRTKRWLRLNPRPSIEEVVVFYPLSQTRKYVKKLFVYQLRYLGASARRE